jgi:hypothetical protein
VTAEVAHVPEHRLLLRDPDRRHQAAAAAGGVTPTIVVSTRAAVRGPQTLGLKASDEVLDLGERAMVVATVSGDGSARTATASLHGPFATASAAGCSGASVGEVSATVMGDGGYALPSVSPGGGGHYAWRVTINGSDTNSPVSSCGATTKVLGQATVTLAAPTSAQISDVVDAQVTLAGLPFGGPVDVTTTLYGPFSTSSVACNGNNQTVSQRRQGNGTFRSLSFQVDAVGWYAWRASVPEGDLWRGDDSPCGALLAVTQVTP